MTVVTHRVLLLLWILLVLMIASHRVLILGATLVVIHHVVGVWLLLSVHVVLNVVVHHHELVWLMINVLILVIVSIVHVLIIHYALFILIFKQFLKYVILSPHALSSCHHSHAIHWRVDPAVIPCWLIVKIIMVSNIAILIDS